MKISITKNSDYSLIEAMADKKGANVETAFHIFHDRYASYIFNCCAKIIRKSDLFQDNVESAAADLSQQVFEKLLQSAYSFEGKSNQTPEKEASHIKGWLYRIIKNLYIDNLRLNLDQSKIVRIDQYNRDQIENEIFNKQNTVDKSTIELSLDQQKKIRLIKEGYDCLNEKDKEIITFYLQSGKFDGRGNWVLPPERMEELCAKYGLKKNSIIQQKGRIVQKIKDYIHNKGKDNEHK